MTVGVLALQGDFAEHLSVLRSLRVACCEVRTLDDLKNVTHLILPGGESTVISSLLESTGLRHEIIRRSRAGSLPLFGTCAGMILLATKLKESSPSRSLGLLNITVDRNAYGTHAQSFQAPVRVPRLATSIDASFIRAPKIVSTGKGVIVLATYEKTPVLVRQGDILAAAFHPEVRGDGVLHKYFLTM